jgi:hypothetical protein
MVLFVKYSEPGFIDKGSEAQKDIHLVVVKKSLARDQMCCTYL